MKSALLTLLACLCIASAAGAERPKRGQMKGMELYSWQADGKWVFVLLDGTNALKSEDGVKKSPDRIATVAALRARFMALAEGEHVVWNFHFVPGFAFPDEKTFSEVMAAAKSANIALIPDRNQKR